MFHLSRWLRLSEAFTRLNRPVVVVDLESTGGNLYQDRVTEIAFRTIDQPGETDS